MNNWLPYREVFLETIISLEAPKGMRQCEDCTAHCSPWRCIDCLDLPSLCTACCLIRHRHDFLHRIEKWTPAFARPLALQGDGDNVNASESNDTARASESDDEDDDEDDEDEAASGEHNDEQADEPIPPVANQGPIQDDEGKLHSTVPWGAR